jgi:ElaB/YqjD/DUF883 family membrane-anchored ribosome-binding protein
MHTTVRARPEDLATNLRQLIAGSEELMSSIRKEGGNQYAEVMKRIDRDIEQAKEQLGELHHGLVTRTRAVARRADRVVNEHPWETAGTAAAAGTLLGIAIGTLIGRANSFYRD